MRSAPSHDAKSSRSNGSIWSDSALATIGAFGERFQLLNRDSKFAAGVTCKVRFRWKNSEPVTGRPVYLGLAMTTDSVLRMKPQNLLVNLPLAESA